jgi:hypothetical protein
VRPLIEQYTVADQLTAIEKDKPMGNCFYLNLKDVFVSDKMTGITVWEQYPSSSFARGLYDVSL